MIHAGDISERQGNLEGLLNGRPVLMQQRTMLDLVDDLGSFIERYGGVSISSAHPELCSTYPQTLYY